MLIRFFSAVFLSFAIAGSAAAMARTGAAAPTTEIQFFFSQIGQLNLSDDQRRDVAAIVKDIDYQSSKKGADADSLQSEEWSRIEAVLSKEQLASLKTLEAKK